MDTIGRYQLAERLGQGGMGVVYRAYDPILERVVAVKLIGAIDSRADLRERFFREARAAGQLSHKNIITIHDLGEHEGQPFLAMEFLEGQDLQQRMAGQTPMTLARKLELAIDVCEAIEYAHLHGVIHRDIKPANIFITSSGTTKILDFGLARLITSELTNSNMMMGTLNYMAPEQVRGERADHRSDVFSTGVVLYELLGGRKAFVGDSFAATLYKILQEVPEPLRNIDPDLPPEIVAIVERALEKTRETRYQHMSEMLHDLTAYRQQLMLLNSPAFGHPRADGSRAPSDAPRQSAIGLSPAEPPAIGNDAPNVPHDAPTLLARPATPLPAAASGSGSSPASLASGPPTVRQPFLRRAVIASGFVAVVLLGAFVMWKFTRDSPPPSQTAAAQPISASVAETSDSAARQAAETITRSLSNARELFESGRFDEASRAAGEVLAVDPENTEAKRLMDESAGRSQGKGADEARERAARARNAAIAAAAPTLAASAYSAAVSAERDASRLLQRGRPAEAMARFWEASGLFRSAEIAAQTEAAGRIERARVAQAGLKATDQAPRDAAAAPASAKPAPPEPPPPPITPAPATGPPLSSVGPPVLTPAVPPPAAAREAPAAEAAVPPTSGITEVLDRYRAALEGRSLPSLKRLWPSLGGPQEAAILHEFENATRIDVEILNPQITVEGTSATVRFIRRYQLHTVDRQRLQTETRTTMNLQRIGATWTINQIRFEPVR
jgi:serine/threonine-protein kinase